MARSLLAPLVVGSSEPLVLMGLAPLEFGFVKSVDSNRARGAAPLFASKKWGCVPRDDKLVSIYSKTSHYKTLKTLKLSFPKPPAVNANHLFRFS